jgi:hypothetical protein
MEEEIYESEVGKLIEAIQHLQTRVVEIKLQAMASTSQ